MNRTVASVEELAPLLELQTVRAYEVTGKRRDGFDLADVPVRPGGAELEVSQALRDQLLIFRCRLTSSNEHAVIIVDVAAHFQLAEPIERPSEAILSDFARTAGLPVVFPYVRMQLAQVARQIGVPAPMLKHYWARDFEAIEFDR